MQTTRRDLLMGTGAAVALGAFPAAARTLAQAGAGRVEGDADAQALIDGITEAALRLSPEATTSLGIDNGTRGGLKYALSDRSPEGQREVAEALRRWIAVLDSVDLDTVTPAMRVNVQVMRTAYGVGLDGFAFPYGDVAVGGYRNTPYPVIQNVGAYIDIPRFLDSDHRIETRQDADAYLSRMEAYPDALDGETERLKPQPAHGVIAPDFLLDKALKQLKIARGGAIEEWGLVTSIAGRTKDMEGDYAARAVKLAKDKVAPALDRQIAELERHRKLADARAGVWKFPDGEEYYAWALRASTTTRMTPAEVHQLGLDEVKRLHAQMDGILRRQGFTKGSVGQRMIAISQDPRYLFPDNDEGRAEIIAFLQKHIAEVRAAMPRAFNTLVPGNFEVKRLPPEEEPGAPGAYGGPGSVDGKTPGRMWINLRTTKLHTRYSIADLSHHEAIPGHIWQGEYTFRQPLIRSLMAFNAYSEGWALYAEQLADELGFFDKDPVGRLGYLQAIAFRACRLVVDTGLHAQRWSREKAIEWFHETNGSGIEEVTSEVDRYCSWPGQACGYKVGHSEINRLRDRAKAALGKRFDFKAFNDAVVTGGNVPMTVLGDIVDRYVAGAKG